MGHRHPLDRFALAAVLGGLVAARLAAGDAPQPWPQANGPFGNFVAPRYGHELVEDLEDARTVWTSEEAELGYAKTSVSGFFGQRANWPGHPGAANSLIAAEGMIFASSFRPAGETWQETKAQQLAKFTPEQQAKIRRALSIDADDITVAIDMATGKTAWKRIEAGRGFFRGMGKRGGWGVSPVYHDGAVISLGTTGRLYAYDARTGATRWEADLGATHRAWEEQKRRCLAAKIGPEDSAHASLVAAEGVVVVPLFDGVDMTLRGVDARTGATRWEVPAANAKTATPALWRHGDRTYVLCATHGGCDYRNGRLRLIDPRDGKVLWTVERLGNNHFSLAPSERHVLVNIGSSAADKGAPLMRFACYRLSPEGATRAWEMPDAPEFQHEGRYEASDWRKHLIRDGRVYFYSRAPGAASGTLYTFSILDEATGAILHQRPGRGAEDALVNCQFYLIEDRILQIPDAAHAERFSLRLWRDDPKRLEPLGAAWRPHVGVTAYNVYMEFPYADGRIYVRTIEGTVRCYDLRRAGAAR